MYSILESGIWILDLSFFPHLFLLDVLIDETMIAIIRSFSSIKELIETYSKISNSFIISSQNRVSSASSSTIESFEMNSAIDLALQAAL